MNKLYFVLTLWLLSFGQIIHAESFKLDKDHSKLEVKGTSTFHDWKAEVTPFNLSLTYPITSLKLDLLVKDIKSDSDGLNSRLYEALKSEEFKEITFVMEGTPKTDKDKVTVSGTLTIAGVAQKISVTGTLLQEGTLLKIKGEHPLKMTDYNIEPPKFLVMKTGNDVQIVFDLQLTKN